MAQFKKQIFPKANWPEFSDELGDSDFEITMVEDQSTVESDNWEGNRIKTRLIIPATFVFKYTGTFH